MLEFLSRIVPSEGLVCLATPSLEHKGFIHSRFESREKAKWLCDKLTAEGRDVYFAVGTLKSRGIEKNGKTVVRVAENIHSMKALFLDLDVGAKKYYKTQGEAVAHLLKFVKEIGLPAPLLVSSGYGIHVYWPFTRAVPADAWLKLAAQFKALVAAYGLHADPSRTSDVASILRLPGSFNHKTPSSPQPVRVLNKHPVPDSELRTLVTTIVNASKQFSAVAKPVSAPAAKVDVGLGSFETPQEPADFKEITLKCRQIGAAVRDQATTEEPVWFAVLQLVRHCQDADTWATSVSNKHPGFDADELAAKMQRLTNDNVGPTLCDTFDSRCAGGCNGCEYRGKIKTPLVLGRSLKEANDKPTMTVDHGNGDTSTIELPNPPWPYMRTTSGAIAIRVKDEDGKELDPEVIYDFDIHPTRRMYDEIDQTEIFFFRAWLPQDGWREFPVPAFLVYDERKLMEVLGRQGVMPDLAQKSRLVAYMLGYIQSLQRSMPADQIYSQFGWRKENTEIVIGNRSYSAKGFRKVKVSDQFARVLPKFEPKGDLEKWKKVVNIYNHPGYEDYAFALMMGFGQLLFKFSGYQGALYNLYGDAGSGKSTVLRLIHSIYGTPTETSLLHQDTTNAKIAMIGCYNNLPITYDEVTNIDPNELSDLCFAVSNGRGKEALKQDRTLRENTATWQTAMFMTSNDPLMPKLIHLKGTMSGETYRLLERRITKTTRFSLQAAREMLEPLNHNYGLAGAVIAEWLVNNVDEARRMMEDAYAEVCNLVQAESQERFWAAMCAQAVVGARLGNKLGLHSYDATAVLAHTKRVILETRGVMVSDTKTPIDVVVEYLNSHISQTLATTIDRLGVPVITRKPMHELMIRHDQTDDRLYITKSHFKDWCVAKHHDATAVQEYMEMVGVLVNAGTNKALGDGTEFVTGRSLCYVLDSGNPAISGLTVLKAVELAKKAEGTTQPRRGEKEKAA